MSHVLHLGDCLDRVSGLASLPDKSIDHFIVDPPYEAEAHTNARRFNKEHFCVEYKIGFDKMTTDMRAEVGRQIARISRGWALIFCQVEAVLIWRHALVEGGAQWRRGMVWVKPDGTPQFTGDRPAQGFECMALAWCGTGRSKWNGGGRRGVYEANVNDFGRLTDGRPHPTQKPLALMEQLVRDFTDPGELICDPFAGSGTTGVACVRLGRAFIGWERDADYHATALRRLDAAREQFQLPRMTRPKQLPLSGPEKKGAA